MPDEASNCWSVGMCCRRLIQRMGDTDCFLAAAIESEEKGKNKKRPLVFIWWSSEECNRYRVRRAAAELQSDVERFSPVKPNGVVSLQAAGFCDGALWAAYDRPLGFPTNEWLSCQGGFRRQRRWRLRGKWLRL